MNSGGRAIVIAILTSGVALAAASRPARQPRATERLIDEGQRLFARVWTVADGLGPTLNARSCVGCHSIPREGGSGTDSRAFVAIAPTVVDPSGGHVFRRLRVETTGAVTEQAPPLNSLLRKAPSLLGSGRIDEVPEAEIGRGVQAPAGRFGWKGRFRSIEDAVAAAFINELGVGSARYPDRSAATAAHNGVELSEEQIQAVSAFIRALPAASVKQPEITDGNKGREIFREIGCVACHRASFPTLEARGLYPYTDLLLHDMGPALADGLDEGGARGQDFKTPPLWGVASTGPPYLHDGRAKNLTEAIDAHGGEAESVIQAWRRLTTADRTLVIAFLRSL